MRRRRQQKQRKKNRRVRYEETFPGVDQNAAENEYQLDADPESYYRMLDRKDYEYLKWWESTHGKK